MNGSSNREMSRALPRAIAGALATAPLASLAFASTLMLTAVAIRSGLITNDALRLWAGASMAADGQVPAGRIVGAYPTLPFLTTTLVAWLAPGDTPAASLVAAGLLAILVAFCFASFRKVGLPKSAAAAATFLVVLHPAMLRAVVAGPAEMFLAVFLLMLCMALYDLRARSGTSEVMAVGMSLMALAFSHPLGAAFAFAAIPFLGFAVRPVLVAHSAFNVVIALTFPTVFAIGAFSYVSWVFPGDGWSFQTAPTESLSLWSAAITRVWGDGLSGFLTLYASLAMALVLVLGAPIAVVMLALVYRRRPLIVPAGIFAAIVVAATAIGLLSGFFGDPTALAVAAPILAAVVVIRVPVARERVGLTVALLVLGWLGGLASLALVDPITVNHLYATYQRPDSERDDTLTAGGTVARREGILVDIDNAPTFILGRGSASGILGPQSEPFTFAVLFNRIDAPFVAIPDPHSNVGANDRLNRAFPSMFRDGAPGYRVIYQNNTWRLFERTKLPAKYKD